MNGLVPGNRTTPLTQDKSSEGSFLHPGKIKKLEERLNKLKEGLPMLCATKNFPTPPSCGSPSPQSQGKSLEQRLDSLRQKRLNSSTQIGRFKHPHRN